MKGLGHRMTDRGRSAEVGGSDSGTLPNSYLPYVFKIALGVEARETQKTK